MTAAAEIAWEVDEPGGNGGMLSWYTQGGAPAGSALMADWDGDGRAEPCLYQNGTFSCDTAHDGSSPRGASASGGPATSRSSAMSPTPASFGASLTCPDLLS